MRSHDHLSPFRITPDHDKRFGTTDKEGMNGVFVIPLPDRKHIAHIICSNGSDPAGGIPWEHVSVHIRYKNSKGKTHMRTPHWEEMAWVKRMFFLAEETVVEYHPAKSNYVNQHPNVLHLWRWKGGEFPVPPQICV